MDVTTERTSKSEQSTAEQCIKYKRGYVPIGCLCKNPRLLFKYILNFISETISQSSHRHRGLYEMTPYNCRTNYLAT